MQRIPRKQTKSVKAQENTAWTTNSDLFMAIAIIFLIMFVYALLSSSASQISVHQERIEAKKFLLGQIPESEKAKTAEEMDQATKEVQDMAAKREILKASLSQLAQLASSIESRESSIKELMERQIQNQGLLEKSQEIIAQKERQIAEKSGLAALSLQKAEKLESDLSAKQKRLASLEASVVQARDDAIEKGAALTSAQKALKERDQEIKKGAARIADLEEALKGSSMRSGAKQLELEGSLAKEKAKIEELSRMADALRTQKSEASKALAEKENRIEGQEREMRKLREAHEARVKDLEAGVEGGARALEDAKLAAAKEAEANARLRDALGKAQAEIAALSKGNQGLERDNAELTAKNGRLSDALEKGKSTIDGLKGSIAAQGQELAGLEGQVKGLGKENGKLKAANGQLSEALGKGQGENEGLKGELGKMGAKLAGLEGQVKGLGKENGELKAAMGEQKAANEKLAQEKQRAKDLKNALAAAEREKGDLATRLEATAKDLAKDKDRLKDALGKGEKLAKEKEAVKSQLLGVAAQNKDLKDDLDKARSEKDRLARSVAALEAGNKALGKDNKELANEMKDLMQSHEALDKKLGQAEKIQVSCEKEKANAKTEQKKLASEVDAHEKKLSGVASTLKEARKAVEDIGTERKRIAKALANNLKASGVEVDVNPETGNITLRMDESFYFKNASYQLRDEAKQKIAQILPVYAKSLLGNPKIAERIEKVLVTGYASPKFNKSYVDPSQAVGEPYEYNLDLSVNRAKEIVAYMFGTQIEAYPHRDQMRSMVSVSGMGLMGAIPLDKASLCLSDPNALKKLEECSCGPYDCKRSRRVEIEFVLKNEKETERQLQKISDKLNDEGAVHVSH